MAMRFTQIDSAVVEGDLTPMIDMAFQLIAFFLLLINFSESEQDERIRLPTSELAKPAEAPLDLPVYLHLTRDGNVIINGEQVPLENVGVYLDLEAGVIKRKERSPSEATVIIRADARAKTGQVQQLIQLAQGRNFEQFALRVSEETVPLATPPTSATPAAEPKE
jgi:biopolymer transport protein ExbD